MHANMKKMLKQLNDKLRGRTSKNIYYDHKDFPVIHLDDDTGIWIQRDDECNGPGVAVHVSQDKDGKNVEVGTFQLRGE